MSTRLERRVLGKSASYTVVAPRDAPGTIFTNKGATGPVTFTLPAATRALLGWWYEFLAIVDQSIGVQTVVSDTAVALNDLAADSLALSTGGQKIGGAIRATCVETVDGTFQWVLNGITVGHTFTVAT